MAQPIAFIDLAPRRIQYFSTLGQYLGPAYAPVFFSLRHKSRGVLRKLHHPLYTLIATAGVQSSSLRGWTSIPHI